ncbi:MAG: hypothetical protein K9N48_00600 [Verrucomicrobia bacterium]|nr:hypothetical protein [Verrucomicrobiota bacterium]
MERSTIYRHAMTPVMFVIGILGLAGGIIGWSLELDSNRRFCGYWLIVGIASAVLSYLMARREALRDKEPFWSPPTRRVTSAAAPALITGLGAGLLTFAPDYVDPLEVWKLPAAWMVLYGCAMHAAGFFMPRGIKLLGMIFIIAGLAFGCALVWFDTVPPLKFAHLIMGAVFGGIQLMYAVYLFYSKRERNGM